MIFKITQQSPPEESAEVGEHSTSIPLSSRRVVSTLFFIACSFLIIHIIGVFIVFGYGINGPTAMKIYNKINMNKEFGIPTIFSFVLLLFTSLLLYLISRIEKQKKVKDWVYWRLLSFVFLYLSLDEAISIHERFSRLKKYLPMGESWFVRRAWVFPYALGVLILGFIFLRFLFRLPKKTRILFIVAGVFYCVAAIGFELPESYFGVVVGNTIYVHLTNGIEEFIEMSSIILFIHALLNYIIRLHVRISFSGLIRK